MAIVRALRNATTLSNETKRNIQGRRSAVQRICFYYFRFHEFKPEILHEKVCFPEFRVGAVDGHGVPALRPARRVSSCGGRKAAWFDPENRRR
jgi:hypothetical protein